MTAALRRPNVAAERAILRLLLPGGLLTAQQIAALVHLTTWTTRRALDHLLEECRITKNANGCYAITPAGREALREVA
ncbi:hypothetical protein [Nocardia wallacei]|uniref:hypothetical protein n=1 Tax=Nocardia wallacei TaxID=480035 RepID=UPI002455EDC8|nr:hypothetical protein [Nocardia wallacei]